jgi:hypothetical protein
LDGKCLYTAASEMPHSAAISAILADWKFDLAKILTATAKICFFLCSAGSLIDAINTPNSS